jgi:hypothetical protein
MTLSYCFNIVIILSTCWGGWGRLWLCQVLSKSKENRCPWRIACHKVRLLVPSQLPTCMHISHLWFESKGNGDHVCINLDVAHTITCGLKVQNLWTCFQGSLLTQNWGLLWTGGHVQGGMRTWTLSIHSGPLQSSREVQGGIISSHSPHMSVSTNFDTD